MSCWTAKQFQTITLGQWLQPPANESDVIQGVNIDTRSLQKGQAFFAILGKHFDGHNFLQSAIDANASILVVEKHCQALETLPKDMPILLVDQTIQALQDLARQHRQVLSRAGTKVIAVTGSNGKTTTRHMIHAILSENFQGTQSPKSFNNHLGVPLTLLEASEKDDFVVVEVGTNHLGEIRFLADIVRPDAAVITHIGHAHLGNFFGQIENIIKEKGELLRHLTRNGLAVIPGNNQQLAAITLPDRCSRVIFGDTNDCNLILSKCQPQKHGQHITLQTIREHDPFGGWQMKETTLWLNLLGKHNAFNAMAAICVAQWMCLNLEENGIKHALEQLDPAPMRLNITPLGKGQTKTTLINDAYNANPDSMLAAIETLQQFPANGRRVAILGDMLELGDQAPAMHRQIGQQLAELENPPIDVVILIGHLSLFIAEAITRIHPDKQVHVFEQWQNDLPQKVAAYIKPDDVILLKASRSMALERLVPAIEASLTQRESDQVSS